MKLNIFLWIIVVFTVSTMLWAATCPMDFKCPVDGATMYHTGDDYANTQHLAIYSHRTASGIEHSVTVPCN